jgi:hypothetical protein
MERSLIFIHGITGNPNDSWIRRERDKSDSHGRDESVIDPPLKARKLIHPTAHHKREWIREEVWPRDLLLKTIPNVRVLNYGYDVSSQRLRQGMNKNILSDIAWELLIRMESLRRSEPLRPLLFVAHSLGGILVEEVLRISRRCDMQRVHLHCIFQSTVGIVFFGMPHAGTGSCGSLHRTAENVETAGYSTNEQVADTFLPSIEQLEELFEEFKLMAQQKKWAISSLQDKYGVKGLNGRKVYSPTS